MTRTMNQRLSNAMERRPNGDLEFSWKRARLHGQHILLEVRDQGNEPTCIFQAVCAAAEMTMMRNLADRNPPSSTDTRFDAELLAHDYEVEVQRSLGKDHDLGHTVRADTALRLFGSIGALATSSGWEGHQRVRLRNYRSLSISNFERVAEYIIQGTPLLGTLPTGDEFRTMLPDEIFEFRRGLLPAGTVASTHMVLFMGFGYRNGRPYLVFLNSNGKSFGDEGLGRVYFDQIYTELFYALNARAPDASVRTSHHNEDASASTSATTQQFTLSSSARPGPAHPDARASTSSTTMQLSSSSTPPTAPRRRDDQPSPPRPAQRRRL
uniref:Peptidase C1A papain C-terminal domain-containing protein n=1 Tax=Oryza meridionalis TaxID=40149 RepID=A0A0E0EMQ8_9ORYZ